MHPHILIYFIPLFYLIISLHHQNNYLNPPLKNTTFSTFNLVPIESNIFSFNLLANTSIFSFTNYSVLSLKSNLCDY